MKTNRILTLLMLLAALPSCYEDKGSYDYRPVNHVTITMPSKIEAIIGDDVNYTPELGFEKTDDGSGFEYWWDFTGNDQYDSKEFGNATTFTRVCDTRELKTRATTLGFNYYRFYVKEKATGCVTEQRLIISVSTTYDKGWMILSDEGGKSVLSFVRPTYDADKKRVFTPDPAFYNRLYPDTPLGSAPEAIGVRYAAANYGNAAIYIFQGEPAVLNGNDFHFEFPFNRTFIGGMPAGTRVRDFWDNTQMSIILLDNDKVYSRNSQGWAADPYSAQFSIQPVQWNSRDMHVDRIFYGAYNLRATPLVNDRDKTIYWYYSGAYVNEIGMILRATYTNPGQVDFDYNDFTGRELVYYQNHDNKNNNGVFSTLYRKDGKLKYQTGSTTLPGTGNPSSLSITIERTGELPEVARKAETDGNIVFHNLRKRISMLFFAMDNTLYWFDTTSGMLQEFYVFPEGDEPVVMEGNPQESELFVCLTGGKIAVLDITHENLMQGKVVYQTSVPGNIVALCYKFLHYIDFFQRNND